MTSLFTSNQNGFGLLSVLAIVLFLSVATTGVLFMISSANSSLNHTETVNKAATLHAAIMMHRRHHGGANGTRPLNLSRLATDPGGDPCTLDNDSSSSTYLSLKGWCGPYVEQIFQENLDDYKTDGWGIEMSYVFATGVITSCGPNRNCGDGDDLTFNP